MYLMRVFREGGFLCVEDCLLLAWDKLEWLEAMFSLPLLGNVEIAKDVSSSTN